LRKFALTDYAESGQRKDPLGRGVDGVS
jgi:hypothetical protein